jgi:DNA-binding CsgD family transcriptional regulator
VPTADLRQRATALPFPALRRSPGTAETAHDFRNCHAARALPLLRSGVDRTGATRHAEKALADPECSADLHCTWIALLTLIFGAATVSADAHLHRLERTGEFAHLAEGADMLSLLRTRCDALLGHQNEVQGTLSRLVRTSVQPELRQIALVWLVHSLIDRGQSTEAASLLATCEVDRQLQRRSTFRPILLMARGTVRIATGRTDSGIEDILSCGQELTSWGVTNPALLPWRAFLVKTAASTGRKIPGHLRQEELAAARRWGSPHTIGVTLFAIGIADDDLTKLEDAADLLEVSGLYFLLPAVLIELATRLARRGDVPLAKLRLERAAELSRRSGNHQRAHRAATELQKLSGEAAMAALSAQEAKTVALAKDGYSNKQIAAKLFVTLRTVEFHLSSSYRKLGISGRRELSSVRIPA